MSETTRHVTFALHDVPIETTPLAHTSLQCCLENALTSGWDFHPEIVATAEHELPFCEPVSQNSLLGAVHIAFSQHRPLTLSPDMLWLAILQGFARHVRLHAAELEPRLMKERGRREISIVIAEPTPWPKIFDLFCSGIGEHTELSDLLRADFTTTGPLEKAACDIALMDVFSPYISYRMACICGIPYLTLEGEVEDWEKLRSKVSCMRGFGIDDWLDEMQPVLDQFVRASNNDVETAWWQQIYKLQKAYGAELVEGWFRVFFPYVSSGPGRFEKRRESMASITTSSVPPGLSAVPVTLEMRDSKERIHFIAGFAGVEDRGESGVRPRISWAVYRGHVMERFVADLSRHAWLKLHAPREEKQFDPQSMQDPFFELPVDLQIFHTATDGGEIAQSGRFFTTGELLQSSPAQFVWKPVASWSDGSIFLAADNDVIRLRWNDRGIECETVARSFSDFVQRLSLARGEAYWCQPFDLGEDKRSEFMRFQTGIRREGNILQAIDEMRKQNQRLRSSKKVRRDEFLFRPPALDPVNSAWPETLRKLYQIAAGIEQTDSWILWPPERVHVLEHTHGRWLIIGGSGRDLILLDRLADRGVALLKEGGKARWLAPSLTDFLTSAIKVSTDVQGLPFWIVDRTLRHSTGNETPFWPDEISARQIMISDPSRSLC